MECHIPDILDDFVIRKKSLNFLPGSAFGINFQTLIVEIAHDHVGINKFSESISKEMALHIPSFNKEFLQVRDVCGLFATSFLSLHHYLRLVTSRDWRILESAELGHVRLALPYFSANAANRILSVLDSWLEGYGNGRGRPVAAMLADLSTSLAAFADNSVNRFPLLTRAIHHELPLRRLPVGGVALGQGVNRQIFSSLTTAKSPEYGIKLAASKSTTALMLRYCGFPTSRHKRVATADEAVTAASAFGYPVVIKPDDAERGEGVYAFLHNAAQVRDAFDLAIQVSQNILLERHVEGFTHRLTVVEGEVIRVVKRIAGGVHGDGRHSVAELIEIARQDPQTKARERRLQKPFLTLDAEAMSWLLGQDLSADSVPEAGEYIRLRSRDNFNSGGSNIEISRDTVHNDNIILATEISLQFGLDIAGIDLIIPDISMSWSDQVSAVCEVNANPQLGATKMPELYDEVLRRLVPAFAEKARIPLKLVIFDEGRAPSITALASRASQSSHSIAAQQGLWKAGRRIAGPFGSGFASARAALLHPRIASLEVYMSFAEAARLGLPTERFDEILLIGLGAEKCRVMRAMFADHASIISG